MTRDRYDGIPPRIARAARARDVANQTLLAALRETYPIGAEVTVHLGRSDVRGVVTGHSEWDFGTVLIVNSETGKDRKFYGTFHKAAVTR